MRKRRWVRFSVYSCSIGVGLTSSIEAVDLGLINLPTPTSRSSTLRTLKVGCGTQSCVACCTQENCEVSTTCPQFESEGHSGARYLPIKTYSMPPLASRYWLLVRLDACEATQIPWCR